MFGKNYMGQLGYQKESEIMPFLYADGVKFCKHCKMAHMRPIHVKVCETNRQFQNWKTC